MSIPNVTLTQGSGIKAVGTQLSVGNNGSPLVYNLIGNQGKITTKQKTDQADTTNQGTVWKQSIPTLLEAGTWGVEIHYIPDSPGADSPAPPGLVGHSSTSPGALGDMFRQQEIRPWKLEWPDGTGLYFEAFILDFPVDADLTKDLMLAMTLQVTGEPVPF